MDKLILKLLKDNGRIIIPDFGALIVKQKSPFKVIFNEFLQYNDGALINALSEKDGISKEDAGEKIKQLTKEFNKKLDAGEGITLEEIGTLIKAPTGKITLSDGTEETEPPKPSEPKIKEEPSKDIEFEVQKKPVDKTPETKIDIPKEPLKTTATQNIKTTPPLESQEKAPQKEAEPKASQSFIDTSTKHSAPPIQEYYQEGSKKNWKSIILWVLLILIVNGAIFGFFFYGAEIKSLLSREKKEIKSPEMDIFDKPSVEQEIAVDTESTYGTPEEDLIIEGQQEDIADGQIESDPIFHGTKYFVVAGVFKIESNADNLVKKLRSKGYNSEKFGKIGLMYAVSYDVFPTKKEADKYLMKIKREVDKNAWIRTID